MRSVGGEKGMQCRRSNTLWRGVAGLCLAFAVTSWSAIGRAQDTAAPIAVAPDGAVLIATGGQFAKCSAEHGRTALVPTPGQTPSTFDLVYVAPATAGILDTIICQQAGQPYTRVVQVESPPPTLTSPEIYDMSFRAIYVLFMLAVLVESGLAVLFNWRPFLEYFDGRGVKTVVALAFSWFFVKLFGLDIVTNLVNIYSSNNYPASYFGLMLTALVIAGGSSGVNKLLVAFGFREVKRADDLTPKPAPQHAWLAVTLKRKSAVGPVLVRIGQAAQAPTDPTSLPIAGSIIGTSSGGGFLRYFVRDKGRFPPSGGYTLDKDTDYWMMLQGQDATGAQIASPVWGPAKLAGRAIVDLDVSL